MLHWWATISCEQRRSPTCPLPLCPPRRYHAKRALYLAHVAAALKAHPELGSLSWECLADDPRRPVLVLHPRQGVSPAGFRIRLLPAAPPELSPLARLAPDRNSLRAAAAPAPATAAPAAAAAAKAGKGAKGAKPAKAGGAEEQPAQLLPTPHYNTSVLQVRPLMACAGCSPTHSHAHTRLAIHLLHALLHAACCCCMGPFGKGGPLAGQGRVSNAHCH